MSGGPALLADVAVPPLDPTQSPLPLARDACAVTPLQVVVRHPGPPAGWVRWPGSSPWSAGRADSRRRVDRAGRRWTRASPSAAPPRSAAAESWPRRFRPAPRVEQGRAVGAREGADPPERAAEQRGGGHDEGRDDQPVGAAARLTFRTGPVRRVHASDRSPCAGADCDAATWPEVYAPDRGVPATSRRSCREVARHQRSPPMPVVTGH